MWERFLNKIVSVKFTAWVVLTVLSFVALWFDKIDKTSWCDLSKWAIVALIVGNGVTKVARAFGKNGNSNPPGTS